MPHEWKSNHLGTIQYHIELDGVLRASYFELKCGTRKFFVPLLGQKLLLLVLMEIGGHLYSILYRVYICGNEYLAI